MLYLDHAATSWPKPRAVLDAMAHWYADLGVSAARGSSRRCSEVAGIVQRARHGVGRLVGMPADRVAFTSGATESINLFQRAFLRRGDRVLTTAFEHAAVARPLVQLQRDLDLRLEVLPPDPDLGLCAATVRAALQRVRPRLFAFSHASNVTGTAFDAPTFCAEARAVGATTLLDASQTIGLLPLDGVGADVVAASAHKALLGPPGLGFLAARGDLDLLPQKQGGTGSSTALAEHPRAWPAAFEAGTPNTPAIVGLDAALALLQQEPPGERLASAMQATLALRAALAADARIRLIGAIFDALDIHVRTGHHCAPWIHAHLGTAAAGTVRLSPGGELSAADIRRVSAALAP